MSGNPENFHLLFQDLVAGEQGGDLVIDEEDDKGMANLFHQEEEEKEEEESQADCSRPSSALRGASVPNEKCRQIDVCKRGSGQAQY